MRFKAIREEYRRRLIANLDGSGVSLLAYCITSNHVHLLVVSDDPEAIPRFMQRQQGEFGGWYNRLKKRKGSFWTDRYHATMIESGEHLWRCMRYCDLNMVRAGAVEHPRKWRWCGYDELTGARQRNRALDLPKVLELTGRSDADELAANYAAFVEEAVAGERLGREAQWTESIAVGSREFVEEVAGKIEGRVKLDIDECGEESWTVRDARARLRSPGRARCLEPRFSRKSGLQGPLAQCANREDTIPQPIGSIIRGATPEGQCWGCWILGASGTSRGLSGRNQHPRGSRLVGVGGSLAGGGILEELLDGLAFLPVADGLELVENRALAHRAFHVGAVGQ